MQYYIEPTISKPIQVIIALILIACLLLAFDPVVSNVATHSGTVISQIAKNGRARTGEVSVQVHLENGQNVIATFWPRASDNVYAGQKVHVLEGRSLILSRHSYSVVLQNP